MNKSLKIGQCLLCERETELTFHHLIPRKLHRRSFFQKKYTKEFLNEGIMICYLCHKGLHKIYDEMKLAKEFSSIETIKKDAALLKHFEWVAKQRKTYKR